MCYNIKLQYRRMTGKYEKMGKKLGKKFKQSEQVCVQPPTPVVNVTLLAYPAELRAVVPLLLGSCQR